MFEEDVLIPTVAWLLLVAFGMWLGLRRKRGDVARSTITVSRPVGLRAGDAIRIGSETHVVSAVISDREIRIRKSHWRERVWWRLEALYFDWDCRRLLRRKPPAKPRI